MVVEQERKRTIRVPLTVQGRGFVYPALTADQLAVRTEIFNTASCFQCCQDGCHNDAAQNARTAALEPSFCLRSADHGM